MNSQCVSDNLPIEMDEYNFANAHSVLQDYVTNWQSEVPPNEILLAQNADIKNEDNTIPVVVNNFAGTKKKRNRTAFSGQQILRLESEFRRCIYMSRERRLVMSQELQLSESQLKTWFQNRRMKFKKEHNIPKLEGLRCARLNPIHNALGNQQHYTQYNYAACSSGNFPNNPTYQWNSNGLNFVNNGLDNKWSAEILQNFGFNYVPPVQCSSISPSSTGISEPSSSGEGSVSSKNSGVTTPTENLIPAATSGVQILDSSGFYESISPASTNPEVPEELNIDDWPKIEYIYSDPNSVQ